VPLGLSPRRARFLGLVGAAVVIALVIGLVVGLRGRTAPKPLAAGAAPGPVVLVPGYGGGEAGLDVLAARLRAAGRDATVLHLPGEGTGDLDDQARALASLVSSTLARTHAGSVDLVGYSAGSIVARLYVQDFGGIAHVRRVVTFGAPNHGADLAASAGALVQGACVDACEQLQPGSALLDALNAKPLSPGPAYVSLRTADDQTVDPVSSAILDGATNVLLQDVCSDAVISHGDLPTSPLVEGIVLRELSAGPVFTPTASDCSALRAAG
jgi:pimeloyl-ACP methyl ester carboxylesterase